MPGLHQKNQFAAVLAEEEVAFVTAVNGANVPSSVAARTHHAALVALCPAEVAVAAVLAVGYCLLAAELAALLPTAVASPLKKPGIAAVLAAPAAGAPVAVLFLELQQLEERM